MSAPQSAWAHPLGKALVDVFRETRVWLIQASRTVAGVYDPVTGTVGRVPATIWHTGGAIVQKLQGPHAVFSKDGFTLQGTQLTLWLDGTTCPMEPNTSDKIWYQDARWEITNIEPFLESDDSFYAYKLECDLGNDATASGQPGTEPPLSVFPLSAYRRQESINWSDANKAPLSVFSWDVNPVQGAVARVGAPVTLTPGTAKNGTSPYTYVTEWQVGDAAGGPFAAIPGATGNSYTPTAGQVGKFIRVEQSATDKSVPPFAIHWFGPALQVQPAALVRATLPVINGTPNPPKFEVGSTVEGVPGTATGGTSPIKYTSRWEISDDGKTGWSTVAGDPVKPEDLQFTAAMLGKHVRYVTVATDSSPTPQVLEIDSAVSPSIAAHSSTPISVDTAPVFSGSLVEGATLTVSTDAVADAGVPPFSYAYRWQHGPAMLGPWTDISGATGKTYTVAHSLVGEYIRVVAAVTDSETTPAPNKLDIPSVAQGPIVGALVVAAAPTLPTGAAPQAAVAYGPAVAGTFTGGIAPVNITNRWEVSSDGSTGWAPISGATALTFTPTVAEVGKYLRLVSIGQDASGTAVQNPSAASAVVQAAAIYCACGEVRFAGAAANGDPTEQIYCAPSAGGNWTYETSYYDFTGTKSGWLFRPLTGAARFIADDVNGDQRQAWNPGTQLTYSAPMGAAADWVERKPGEWHNLRTGQWTSNAPLSVWKDGSTGHYTGPGGCGIVIAPSPVSAVTVLHNPTPATGTWTQSGTSGVPTWTQSGTGAQVHQYGDPAVIGIAGAVTLVWLGADADPWQNDGAGHWSCPATGQTWPTGGGTAPTGTRPQPHDTATLVIPAGTSRAQLLAPSPRWQYWPAAAIPKVDGTPNPTFDPWVKLPTVSPVTWWNYVTGERVQQTAKPPIEQWVEAAHAHWYRQTDGLQLTQARRPDLPADTAADWWESPTGTWHSMLRSEIYVQAANPGISGNVVAITAATPKGVAGDWTEAPTGVWKSTKFGLTVTQPGNPGIAGVIGPSIADLAQGTKPAITGVPQVGEVLTGSDGTATGGKAPINTTRTWQIKKPGGSWTVIPGETGTTYTPVAGDVGGTIQLEVTYTDADGRTLVGDSYATAAVTAAAVPLAAGTVGDPVSNLHVGDTVTWHVGSATGGKAPVTHSAQLQWSADGTTGWTNEGTPLTSKTTTGTYTLVAGDVGRFYRVVDTITDSATPTPASVTDTSGVIGPVVSVFEMDTPPTISGTETIGSKLTGTAGTTVGGTAPINPGDIFAGVTPGPTWQWQRAPETTPGSGTPGTWVNIAGATSSTYTIVAADGSHFLRLAQINQDSSVPAKTCTGYSTPTGLIPAPPPYTMVRGIAFGSSDTWTLGFKYTPAMTSNNKVLVYWKNNRTGKTLFQPIDPHTAVPGKTYNPGTGLVDYPAFGYKKGATGWGLCGATRASLSRHTILASEVDTALSNLPRTYINVQTVTGVGTAYQMASVAQAC